MTTIIEIVTTRFDNIRKDIEDLILIHSEIYPTDHRGTLIPIPGDHAWKKLDSSGKQLQSKVTEDYSKNFSFIETLLVEQPYHTLRELKKYNSWIKEIIEHNNQFTFFKNVNEAFQKVDNYLKQLLNLVQNLYGIESDEIIIVPDTNALLYNPNIESWKFEKINSFQIILTPLVLSELDKLKISNNQNTLREKAEKIIKRIKEYRRRGSLNTGVTIVKNKISLSSIAIEPKFETTLSWLDQNNNDDRLIASFIEITRKNPRTKVLLITRDINLQNKFEFAGLPFDEPPDP